MGTIMNATPITNSEIINFDGTSVDNYYSFTMIKEGNILVSGSDSNSYAMNLQIFDADFNYVDYYIGSSSESITLSNAGTYYVQAIDEYGGSFSISSTAMSGVPMTATSIKNGQTISFDSTSVDNYYSFTMIKEGNILVSGSDSNSYAMNLQIFDADFNYVDYYIGSSSESITLSNAGTYYVQAIDEYGGSFSISSTAMSSNSTPETPTIPDLPSEINKIEEFVNRFYTEVLERPSDESGLESWSSQLENGTKTADDIANGFFFSEEFKNKNLDNDDFVEIAYEALLGREADLAGKNHWINNLDNGMSRSDILDGFIYSDEFKNIANNYGIEVGSPIPEPEINEIVNSWDDLVGFYLFESMELETAYGSSFNVNKSDLGYSYLDISEDGDLDIYFSGNGISEEISGQITAVSNNSIYIYDSYYDETDDMNYLFDGDTLTLYDSVDGYDATMDWILQ
ncbi:DUF4214 domain-containing protein [Aliarcobacter cryaerophilus]|uniref:DUF4214 domain-containing protein n=1 Tax=Aliarcobacter cryaerophilus TaxID=28198 RepID=A0A2S9SJY8_9BACT|nr:DUF4214 domain-containing protein [Aliarcobacter cryaerophilus]PRM86894.1 hypothetical protein CJ669_10330 [Aliarcobacter cryaerophilus]